jgi:hypothetical protein
MGSSYGEFVKYPRTHTKMVCAQLPLREDWSSLTAHEQIVLFFAALFHDSGKPLTSEVDAVTGRISSPKHAVKGGYLRARWRQRLP